MGKRYFVKKLRKKHQTAPEVKPGSYYADCRYAPMLCVGRDCFGDLIGIDLIRYQENHGGSLKGHRSYHEKHYGSCGNSCGPRLLHHEEAKLMAFEDNETRYQRERLYIERVGDYAPGGRFYMKDMKRYTAHKTLVFSDGSWEAIWPRKDETEEDALKRMIKTYLSGEIEVSDEDGKMLKEWRDSLGLTI